MYAEDREGNLKALWPLDSVIEISFLIRDFIYYPGITCHPDEDNDSSVYICTSFKLKIGSF